MNEQINFVILAENVSEKEKQNERIESVHDGSTTTDGICTYISHRL